VYRRKRQHVAKKVTEEATTTLQFSLSANAKTAVSLSFLTEFALPAVITKKCR
jgi:hypothetical protein